MGLPTGHSPTHRNRTPDGGLLPCPGVRRVLREFVALEVPGDGRELDLRDVERGVGSALSCRPGATLHHAEFVDPIGGNSALGVGEGLKC
jgi:hypothetical protein